jgi:tetratricopeptide (TPR) repeat protein
MRKVIFLILLLIAPLLSAANTDSLKIVWKTSSLHDTVRLKALNLLLKSFVYENPDSTETLGKMSVEWARRIKNSKWEINGLNITGVSHALRGDFLKALSYFEQSLTLSEAYGDKILLAHAYGNLGSIYRTLSDYPKSLEYQERSLKLKLEMDQKDGVALSLNNIGNLYNSMSEYNKAIEYYNRALKIQRSLNDKRGIALSLHNMGGALNSLRNYYDALKCYEESMQLRTEIGDNSGIVSSMISSGIIFNDLNQYDKSEERLKSALVLAEELGDKIALQQGNSQLAKLFLKKKEYNKALTFAEKGYEAAKSVSLEHKKSACFIIYSVLKEMGNRSEALGWHELYISYSDSLDNKKKTEDFTRKELQYEYEKKAAADSIRIEHEKSITAAKLEQEKMQRYALYGGILLLVVFGAFMFNRFRVTQKQKYIIEEQKNIVDEKQKEILASIQYAKRIQTSLLPTEKYVENTLKRMKKD